MRLNGFRRIVQEEWLRTPFVRPNVELDEFVIMPNHVDGIVILWNNRDGGSTVGANSHSPRREVPFRSPSRTVGAIVRGFKSATTTRINTIRNAAGAPVWQRNYYERIIRDLDELGRIREYIRNNELQWFYDKGNKA